MPAEGEEYFSFVDIVLTQLIIEELMRGSCGTMKVIFLMSIHLGKMDIQSAV
jgi:hypothetical protein